MKSCNKMGVGFKTVIIDELPDFDVRARKFKEAVLKAEKKIWREDWRGLY